MTWYANGRSDVKGSQPRIVTGRIPAGATKTDKRAHQNGLRMQSDKHRLASANIGAEMSAEMVALRCEIMETAENRTLRTSGE
jgi:hypothetical protein